MTMKSIMHPSQVTPLKTHLMCTMMSPNLILCSRVLLLAMNPKRRRRRRTVRMRRSMRW